jgi:hypothetical protein
LNKELAAECLHTPNDSQRNFNGVTDSVTLEETSTEVIEEAKTIIREPRHPTHRHGVSHRHGGSDSAIINSDCKENDKKTNTMQLPLHSYRNCTAKHGHEPLKK